jgi:hypothetical protein
VFVDAEAITTDANRVRDAYRFAGAIASLLEQVRRVLAGQGCGVADDAVFILACNGAVLGGQTLDTGVRRRVAEVATWVADAVGVEAALAGREVDAGVAADAALHGNGAVKNCRVAAASVEIAHVAGARVEIIAARFRYCGDSHRPLCATDAVEYAAFCVGTRCIWKTSETGWAIVGVWREYAKVSRDVARIVST